MTLQVKKQALKGYLLLKVQEEDWKGVRKLAKQLRELSVIAKLTPQISTKDEKTQATAEQGTDAPSDAILPRQDKTPHVKDEVLSLLRMGDEDLIDKLFPDYSKTQTEGEAS